MKSKKFFLEIKSDWLKRRRSLKHAEVKKEFS
jgi:hypothetical protein